MTFDNQGKRRSEMWFYQKDQRQQGPVGSDVMARLVAEGEVGRDCLVWREGMGDWAPVMATELGEELKALVPPPTVPAVRPSASWRGLSGAEEARRLNNQFLAFWICLAAGVPLSVIVIGAVGVIAAAVLYFVMLYKFWELIQDGEARTTPGKAVGFCFIPFFNLYWVFVAFQGLAQDMNRYIADRGLAAPKVSEGLTLTYCILILCSLVPFLGIVAGVAACVVWILAMKQLKDAAVGILESRVS